jgi:hypothetical protein
VNGAARMLLTDFTTTVCTRLSLRVNWNGFVASKDSVRCGSNNERRTKPNRNVGLLNLSRVESKGRREMGNRYKRARRPTQDLRPMLFPAWLPEEERDFASIQDAGQCDKEQAIKYFRKCNGNLICAIQAALRDRQANMARNKLAGIG